MRKFNAKLFLVLMAIVAVVTGTMFGVSYLQKPRIARALLWHSRKQEDQGDTRQMAKYLQRYLEFVPTDLAEKAHLGRVWTSEAYQKEPRVRLRGMELLTEVLTKEPNQPDLRRLVVKTALDPYINDTKTARDNLQILWNDMQAAPNTTNPKDTGEIESLWGQLLEAEQKPAEAIPWYRQAVEHAPAEETSYFRLAYLLRRQNETNSDQRAKNFAEADSLLDKLVERNNLSYKAYVSRWRYRCDFNQLTVNGILNAKRVEECGDDVTKALERAPEEVDVLIAAADKERLLGAATGDTKSFAEHRTQARKYLQTGLDLQAQPGYKGASDAARFHLLWHLAELQLDVSQSDLTRRDEAGERARHDLVEAGHTLDTLKTVRYYLPAGVQYLEGRLNLLQGQWGDAARNFEAARPELRGRPELQYQCDLFLGACYEKLEQPTQMFAACQRAATYDSNSVAARIGMAKAQWAQGRRDEARASYSQLIQREKVPVEELLELAKMEVQCQFLAEKPDWQNAENALKQAEAASQDNPPKWVSVQLLRAEMKAARGDSAGYIEAGRVLDAAREKYPKDVDLWTAKAFLQFKQQPKEAHLALGVLEDACKAVGEDRVEFRLAEARIAVQAPVTNPKATLDRLKNGIEIFNDEERATLLDGLAEAWYVLGEKAEARKLWQELSQLPANTNDLRLRLMLFDLAMADDDLDGMNRMLVEIKNIEKTQGTFQHLGEALRQIWLARNAKGDRKAPLTVARLHLDQVVTPMPRVELARAEIAQLAGNSEEALKYRLNAIRMGETNPQVLAAAATALYQRNRKAEADLLMQGARESVLLRPGSGLGKIAAMRAAERGQWDRARELAEKTADPNNFRDLIWQARLLFVAKRDDQAFVMIRDAIQKAPHESEPWVALVQFYHARGNDKEALLAIQDADKQIQGDRKVLALAQCYEAVGDLDRASKCYDEALTVNKKEDIAVIRAVCGFYLKMGRLDAVSPLLEKIVSGRGPASPADQEWAKQSLAYVLSATTDFAQFRKALDLVGVKLDEDGKLVREPIDPNESTDALRTKAHVMATQSQSQFRKRAIELLGELRKRDSLLPDDRFVLALLYEGQGDKDGWIKARQEFQALCMPVSEGEQREYLNDVPRYLSRFVQGLIRHNEIGDAQTGLTNLAALEKQREVKRGAFGTVELEARLLEAEKRGDEAVALLKTYAERPGANAAEVLQMVASYQRQQRFKEGLALLDSVRDRCPPEVVGGFYVSLCYGKKPNDPQLEGVQKWLQEQIAKREDESTTLPSQREKEQAKARGVALQMHLAALFDLRGRYPDAEAQYKKILQVEPNNVVALNNLAWLRAQRTGSGDEALRDINAAIAGIGRQSLLLDTRGLVFLAQGQTDKALADFKEAADDAPTPAILFHLAKTLNAAKDRNAAQDVLRRARTELGLDPAKLHPVEQEACSKLLAEYHIQ